MFLNFHQLDNQNITTYADLIFKIIFEALVLQLLEDKSLFLGTLHEYLNDCQESGCVQIPCKYTF